MNMKTTYLLFFITAVVAITSAKAQVKIGAPTGAAAPNSGAILDAGNTAATAATYKGIYLPQVALSANNVYGLNTAGSAVAVNGMLIYNTATAGSGTTAVTPGTYIWNNSVWNPVNTFATIVNSKNIYEGDGTLTGNRNVGEAGFNLGFTGGNVGMGTTTPTNQLQVVAATATTDPVCFAGLQPADATAIGTLVTDINGVIRVRSANTISAVRVTGNLTNIPNENASFNYIDGLSSPMITFDNLGEFSGHTFTAMQAGLYQVTFKINYDQYPTTTTSNGTTITNDGGDGYLARVLMSGSSVYGKITVPEANHYPSSNTVTTSILSKLTKGGKVTFQVYITGASGVHTASYVADIVRID
jgi:hypothetical protein